MAGLRKLHSDGSWQKQLNRRKVLGATVCGSDFRVGLSQG